MLSLQEFGVGIKVARTPFSSLSQSVYIISSYKTPNQLRGTLALKRSIKLNVISAYVFVMLNRDQAIPLIIKIMLNCHSAIAVVIYSWSCIRIVEINPMV